jgi:hypothetical protein
MLPNVFAQSIGEYGGVGSLASTIQQFAYSASVWVGTVTPTTWIVAAAVLLGLMIVSRR